MNQPIPKHLMSEANIQAQFYTNCQYINLNCTLEICVPNGRLDILIFSQDWKTLLCIVECKRGAKFRASQLRRYRDIGVVVYELSTMDSMDLAKSIKASEFKGVPWDQVMSQPRREWRKRRVRMDGILQKRFSPMNLDEDINFRAD